MAALPWVGAGFVVLLGLVVLGRPLVSLMRLIFRTLGGFCFLSLIQPIGLGLGANGANALVLGLLGAPGFGLLLMLQWALR